MEPIHSDLRLAHLILRSPTWNQPALCFHLCLTTIAWYRTSCLICEDLIGRRHYCCLLDCPCLCQVDGSLWRTVRGLDDSALSLCVCLAPRSLPSLEAPVSVSTTLYHLGLLRTNQRFQCHCSDKCSRNSPSGYRLLLFSWYRVLATSDPWLTGNLTQLHHRSAVESFVCNVSGIDDDGRNRVGQCHLWSSQRSPT